MEEIEEKPLHFWNEDRFWYTLLVGYMLGLIVGYLIMIDKAMMKKPSQPLPLEVNLHLVEADDAQDISDDEAVSEATGGHADG